MKTAIVTGTKLGVGNGLVTRLSSLGYHVIATSRDPNFLILNKENFGWGVNVDIEHLDLSDKGSIDKLYSKYKDIQLDLLVNNAAGGSFYEKDGENLFDSFSYSTSLNIGGPSYLTKLFKNNLKKSDNPTVVFISSFAAKYPYPGDVTYCVSKHGVSYLSEIFRIEMSPMNIKVTEIRPASINTREDNPNMSHLNVEDIVNTIIWVSEMPKHCNIDLIEISEIRTRKHI